MPVERVFSIFRRIEIPHPKSEGVIVDDPLIQIGTATLRESIGKLGKAFVASADISSKSTPVGNVYYPECSRQTRPDRLRTHVAARVVT